MSVEFVMKEVAGPSAGTMYSTYIRDDGADGNIDTILSFAIVTFPVPGGQTFPYVPPVGCWSRIGVSPCALPLRQDEVEGTSRIYADTVAHAVGTFVRRRGPSL